MATITKFEDLIAWQEARALVKMVYQLTSDGSFSKDFGMRDQIQRASVSAMTNIAEGFLDSCILAFFGKHDILAGILCKRIETDATSNHRTCATCGKSCGSLPRFV